NVSLEQGYFIANVDLNTIVKLLIYGMINALKNIERNSKDKLITLKYKSIKQLAKKQIGGRKVGF
uniref:hypothetical protein n=1 Tax=Proteiniborus sp. TaxID=2079015 RepID=UPI00332FAD25